MGCGASRDLKIGHSVNESADLSSLPSSTSSGLLQESDKGSDGVFAEGSVVDSICEDRFQEFHDDEHISPKNSASHVSFWSKIQSSIQRAPSSITEEKTRQPATSTSSSLHGGQRLSRHTERKRVNEVDRPKVSPENAYSGMLVTLDIEGFSMSGLARFPGDTGPGVMLEDHFGDKQCWRVRWATTNCWGIYNTGFNGEFQLFCGVDDVAKDWDDENFYMRGRMPSLFFCAGTPANAETRAQIRRFSSPRSRVLSD